MDIDDLVDRRDDKALVKALINPVGGIEYRGTPNKPFIQILRDGCWFIQKSGSCGLGKSRLESLIQSIKQK